MHFYYFWHDDMTSSRYFSSDDGQLKMKQKHVNKTTKRLTSGHRCIAHWWFYGKNACEMFACWNNKDVRETFHRTRERRYKTKNVSIQTFVKSFIHVYKLVNSTTFLWTYVNLVYQFHANFSVGQGRHCCGWSP